MKETYILIIEDEEVDIRVMIGSFAMDVISACAYGIKIDSIQNPQHPIVQNAKKFFAVDANISMLISFLAPQIARFLKLEFFDANAVKFFDELTNQIVKERKKINKFSIGEKSIFFSSLSNLHSILRHKSTNFTTNEIKF